MESFIQILILLGFMVAGAVVCKLRLAPPPKVTDIAIKLVLWALLFVMGFRLGNVRELHAQLGGIGLLAVGTAIASLTGTVLAIWLAYEVIDTVKKNHPGNHNKPNDSINGQKGKATAPSALRPGLAWSHFKGPSILLGVVVAGFIAGLLSKEAAFDYGRVTGWVLNALLFMIGLQFAQSNLSLKAAFVRVETVLIPSATLAGTLAGGLVVALLFRLSVGKALALSAGFGWYTLSGVLISDLGDPALGSAAFLANMARESMAFILIPILSVSRQPYAAIGVAGAAAMDVTLPLIEQCLGPDSVPVSFTSGAILSLLVPVLVPIFYKLV